MCEDVSSPGTEADRVVAGSAVLSGAILLPFSFTRVSLTLLLFYLASALLLNSAVETARRVSREGDGASPVSTGFLFYVSLSARTKSVRTRRTKRRNRWLAPDAPVPLRGR